jgi:hypothetical protein
MKKLFGILIEKLKGLRGPKYNVITRQELHNRSVMKSKELVLPVNLVKKVIENEKNIIIEEIVNMLERHQLKEMISLLEVKIQTLRDDQAVAPTDNNRLNIQSFTEKIEILNNIFRHYDLYNHIYGEGERNEVLRTKTYAST